MAISQDLADFMTRPVMIILGTCDAERVPEIARAVGAVVHRREGFVDLMTSEWQWPRTVANVQADGQLAVTFARPSDYVSYQIKGLATVVPTTAEHIAQADHYVKAMTLTLEELGLDPWLVAPWLVSRSLVTLRLAAQAIFVQTPGSKAGQLIEQQP